MPRSPQEPDTAIHGPSTAEPARPAIGASQNPPPAQLVDPDEAALLALHLRHIRESSYLHAPAEYLRVR